MKYTAESGNLLATQLKPQTHTENPEMLWFMGCISCSSCRTAFWSILRNSSVFSLNSNSEKSMGSFSHIQILNVRSPNQTPGCEYRLNFTNVSVWIWTLWLSSQHTSNGWSKTWYQVPTLKCPSAPPQILKKHKSESKCCAQMHSHLKTRREIWIVFNASAYSISWERTSVQMQHTRFGSNVFSLQGDRKNKLM